VGYGYHLVTDCLEAKQGNQTSRTRTPRAQANDHPPLQHLHEHHGDRGKGPFPTARKRTSWVTNQELTSQPGPEHDPRNQVLTSAVRVEAREHAGVLPLHQALRDLGLSEVVLVGKLKKDISSALRRGTIAHVTPKPSTASAAQLAA
jgi:hypothetical protein